jgi:hypothetical protein
MNDHLTHCGYLGGMMSYKRVQFGRKLLLIVALLLFMTPAAYAQSADEAETGFFTSILQRLGIGGDDLPEGVEPEPLINPVYVTPILAGVALGGAGILIFLGYQPPLPKRDPFNRRL